MIEVGKVGMIPLKSIIVEDRARQEMGNLDEAESNMKQIGLTTPLTLLDNKDGTYRLLAGERRFRILERNNNELIPARIYEKELSPLEIKIIEKSENFYRKDFEYWEYDKLVLEITEMEQELHGVKSPGPVEGGHSLSDTGEMLGVSKGTVSMAIKRAEAREAFPELFTSCKTASDATKVLKKVNEEMVKKVIAQKLESCEMTGTLDKLSKCFIVNDFFEGIKQVPNGIMHLVEIDPPYGIDLQKQKKKDGESQYQLENYNEVDTQDYQAFLANVFKECYRVMADHSWLLCWFAMHPWFETVFNELNKAGFESTRLCGIWIKKAGQSTNPSIRLANAYETFFYAWKGKPALNKAGRSNVFNFNPVSPQNKVHPTERPVDLMKEIYDTFAFTGSRVLIPFLGSGSGLIAAHELGMSPVGFEISSSYRDSFLVRVHNMSRGIQ